MSRDHQTLPRLFLDLPFADGAVLPLEREQMHYLVNVLRLEAGDLLKVFNGKDGEWLATLIQPTRKTAALGLREAFRPQTTGSDIWYCFAPLKHARLDYIVQKAVEMGASRICPVLTRRTQSQRIKDERMRANVIEAAEQCGILTIPSVEEAVSLPELVGAWPKERLLVLCDEEAPLADPVAALAPHKGKAQSAILIGPEGGFADEERALLARIDNRVTVSLGPRILRADTAGVAAMALVQAVVGDWG